MSNNIEIEAKVLISENEYNHLVNKLGNRHFEHFLQTNYYIESEERVLDSFGFALRIRKNTNYTLTLKTPLAEGILEKNQVITKEEYSALLNKQVFPEGDIKRFLELLGINIKSLKIMASLTTARMQLEYHDGLLCIDKSTYNGRVDYEIELEESSMENAENTIKELLEEMGIKKFEFNTISKYARAMATR